MRKLFLLVSVFICAFSIGTLKAQLVTENFDYSLGQLTSGGGGADVSGGAWVSFSGTGAFIPVISGNLTYSGYSASGIGNMIQLVAATTSAEDARTDFLGQSGDGTKVYASFLVNIQSAPASGSSSYFASLYSTANGYKGRVFAQTLGSGIEFGLEGSGSAPVFTGVELALNQTHLIVVCYEFLAGADSVKLWVNPTISSIEPTPDLTYEVATDFTTCDAFALRQASSSGVAQNPDAEIDGLLVSNAWSDIVPVELTSFNALVKNNGVSLNWITATELNNSGFEVERKSGNTSWSKLAFIDGHGTTTSPNKYSYFDGNLSSGKYSYRLKQIDFDGSYVYSKVVETNIDLPSKFELAQNYPNPFNPNTVIAYSLPKAGHVTLKVYNALGQEVSTLVNGMVEAGNHDIKFNASGFSSGIYYYRLEADGLIAMKKMMLLK